MNNYGSFPKNYNYLANMIPNNINNQGITNNNSTMNLYDPYEGFIRGNMFKNMYDPYKGEKPFQIQPMNEQAKMLTEIDSLSFAMIDLNLYLDVNPNDKNAINLYNQYRVQKENLLNSYERQFGPIMLNSEALTTVPWAWDNRPWPWEN